MQDHSQKRERIDFIVSTLNNYLETHAYLFAGEYCGEPSDIVSCYGFGYNNDCDRVLHWIEDGDGEECAFTLDEIESKICNGLTNESLVEIMEKCS